MTGCTPDHSTFCIGIAQWKDIYPPAQWLDTTQEHADPGAEGWIRIMMIAICYKIVRISYDLTFVYAPERIQFDFG